ncbi:arginine deiminase-related protein [Rhizobium sp. ZPR3]|uniref:Arginine deiminase-related protein n=2 Tax=unclassified Rhizobium TaxID=2613769 RepID=A0AAU7SM01_9HYPH
MAHATYSVQAPSAVVMVRPHHFTVNTQTAADNRFQLLTTASDNFASQAFEEITRAAEALERQGVTVHLFEDDGVETPDSVFPNNWFSTHAGGHIAIYPMKVPNRRRERRSDVVDMLKQRYRVQDVIDYSGLEPDGLFLEGTGAMVLDHIDRVAYAVRSDRTDPIALERFCTHFNFEPMLFDARDDEGVPVYHTNVLMCVATNFTMIGSGLITDSRRRDEILARLQRSGRDVIHLTNRQIAEFAGNAIELQGTEGRILALSTTALAALDNNQRTAIERHARIIAFDLPTIERAGGSVRCTLAGIHLTPRSS